MSTIAGFFAQRSVFITGGSGFLGQQTIEKLLRSCPEIESIYVLTRPKKGQNARKRIDKLISKPLFDKVRSQQPEFHRKVIPIEGNVEQPGLGISDSDHARVKSNVSLFMHVAASIHFNDTLRKETSANLFGTQNAIQLCKELKNPEVFVHMSTIGTQSEKSFIQECFYEPKIKAEQLSKLVSILDDKQLSLLESDGLNPLPNTYAFSKAAAEFEVAETIGRIPCAVIRTGGIGPAYAEPIPGWCDNANAGNALYAAIGLGMLPLVSARSNSLIEASLPVDLMANFLVAVTWYTAVHKTSDDAGAKVYNFVGGNESPLTMGEFIAQMDKNCRQYPLSRRITGWSSRTTENKTLLTMYDEWLRMRCLAIDAVTKLGGGKPRAMKLYNVYSQVNDIFEYFMKHEFVFDEDNVREVERQMSPIDKQIFNISRKIDWDKHFKNSWLGIKKFYFKDIPKEEVVAVEETEVLRTKSERS